MAERRRALLSTYDKTGVVDLAKVLVRAGWELLSSGGTAAVLAEAGITVQPLAELTGFGEMLSHRVVTLHPAVHGALLADRDDPTHLADLAEHGIEPIDLVVVNLYPFASDPGIELIDIGGPTMVRAAAKNHAHVGVLVDPSDYAGVVDEVEQTGELSVDTRRALAVRAFEVIADYDVQIAGWMRTGALQPEASASPANQEGEDVTDISALPERLTLAATRSAVLRYGENPHQVGARYRTGNGGCWDDAVQHQGKDLSYLNVYDIENVGALLRQLQAVRDGARGFGILAAVRETVGRDIHNAHDQWAVFRPRDGGESLSRYYVKAFEPARNGLPVALDDLDHRVSNRRKAAERCSAALSDDVAGVRAINQPCRPMIDPAHSGLRLRFHAGIPGLGRTCRRHRG